MRGLLDKLRELEAEKPRVVAKGDSTGPYHCVKSYALSLFTGFEDATPERLSALYRLPELTTFRREGVVFLDTETTGLSGGAGTIAFQIGIGYFTQSGFTVEQYMVHSYAEEAMMLNSISAMLKRFSMIATFNGRTFDVPLLKSRFLMCRIPDTIPSLHADVLYPARRLWKLRLHSCKLSHLEEELLHVERADDLPGALVPQTFFQYTKDGNFEPMLAILRHNQQDIVSLAQLFFAVCSHTAHPEKITHDEDLLSLAEEMSRQSRPEAERKCYRLLTRGKYRPEAFLHLAQQEKKDGHEMTAVRLYETMLKRGDKPIEACIALAKLYEHRLNSPETALAYTRKALLLMAEPKLSQLPSVQETQKALQYRYTRLLKKCRASKEEDPC